MFSRNVGGKYIISPKRGVFTTRINKLSKTFIMRCEQFDRPVCIVPSPSCTIQFLNATLTYLVMVEERQNPFVNERDQCIVQPKLQFEYIPRVQNARKYCAAGVA